MIKIPKHFIPCEILKTSYNNKIIAIFKNIKQSSKFIESFKVK